MKSLKPTIFALILTITLSSTALAGNIAGGRAAGTIAGGRAAGTIAGGRASSAASRTTSIANPDRTSRLELEIPFSESFRGLIRFLLESGALF